MADDLGVDVDILAYQFQDELEFEDTSATARGCYAPPEIQWYHGKMSRADASNLLSQHPPGSYLVRASVRNIGDYSISFRTREGSLHYRVLSDEYGGFFISDSEFKSLGETVEYFCNHALADNMTLMYPVAPAVPLEQKREDVVIAIESFSASSSDELSVLTGDRLTICNDTDPYWLFCKREGATTQGFVPRHCVRPHNALASEREAAAACQLPPRLHRTKWLHGKITRGEAEELLLRDGSVGSFLIRESTNPIGDYSLSFRMTKKNVEHFKIKSHENMTYTCGGHEFTCLEQLVLHYTTKPLKEDMLLGNPVSPAQFSEFDVEGDLYSDVQYEPVARSEQKQPKPIPAMDRQRVTGQPSQQGGYSHQGYITRKMKKSNKWKPLFFVLDASKQRLITYHNPQAIKAKGMIDLGSSVLARADDSLFGRPNSFLLNVNGSEVYLCTDTPKQLQGWLNALRPVCGASHVGEPIVADRVSHLVNLSVNVAECKNLDTKAVHLAMHMYLGGFKVARSRTNPVKSQSVFFGEEFKFENLASRVSKLRFELVQADKRKPVILGEHTVDIKSLTPNQPTESWVALTSGSGQSGKMRIKISLLDEVILPHRQYQQFQSALQDTDVRAVQVMGEAFKGQLNEYARHLVRVWASSGKDVELLCMLNHRVIAKEESTGTLFRGNSLATKAMDQYMKLIAIEYLHQTLGQSVRSLCEEKRSCEMDQTRGGNPRDAEKVLRHHCQAICKAIFESAANCPSQLCAIFQHLQRTSLQRFPNEPIVRYTIVSAFIFLRLVCPAIINPKLFNMLSDHPTEMMARNLTLVAKVIQNLANMTEFGAKEAYMTPINGFIIEQRAGMQQYIDSISTVKPDQSFEVEQVSVDLAAIARMAATHQDQLVAMFAEQRVHSTLPQIVAAITSEVARN